MARPPRGGFRPAQLGGTLGSLIKSTLAQAGVVRDVLESGVREGRSRLDEARAGKRRHDALAELGEAVLELVRRGEIDLAELPEIRQVVADLDELDAGSGGGGGWRKTMREDEPWEGSDHDGGLAEVTIPSGRERFDRRGRAAADGTVSSSRWSAPSKGGSSGSGSGGIWRPPAVEPLPKPIARAHKGGGISFDDEDLADYMHPDDVPPKPPHDE